MTTCAPADFMKRSNNGGLTWSDELALPPNWAEIGRGAPTIHRLADGRGKARMYVFCRTQARTTFLQGITEDDGKTWSELRPVATAPPESGPITGWTGPMTIVEATAPDGRRRHMMWYERARGVDQGPEPGVIWQSASYDGGLTWGESKPIVDRAAACEPACVRSPDGKQLLLLIRDESRQANSLMATSDDEGETWSPPRELPLALTGDRFLPRYALDGRPGLNDVVTTPTIDRLAREGILFRNAFVSSPSCTPCRSSLLSVRPAARRGGPWTTSCRCLFAVVMLAAWGDAVRADLRVTTDFEGGGGRRRCG